MNLNKKTLSLYHVVRVCFILFQISYAVTFVFFSLGRSIVPYSILMTLYYGSQIFYLFDFLVVLGMFYFLLRKVKHNSHYLLKAVRIIIGINVVIKIIMAIIWLGIIEIYSTELDLVYYFLETGFILTTIVMLGYSENNAED